MLVTSDWHSLCPMPYGEESLCLVPESGGRQVGKHGLRNIRTGPTKVRLLQDENINSFITEELVQF
jgi:hypothetical protein